MLRGFRFPSEVGAGSTVCIYLPRHQGECECDIAPQGLAALVRAGNKETILVVDDEPTVRMLLVDMLEEPGYAVVEAADSLVGLRILQSDAAQRKSPFRHDAGTGWGPSSRGSVGWGAGRTARRLAA